MAFAVDPQTLLAAVTEPTRRHLLDLFLEDGDSTATALADSLPITRQAVSKQLAVLTRVGLVRGERCGRELRYHLDIEHLREATKSLVELADAWDRRLARIKRVAEGASQTHA